MPPRHLPVTTSTRLDKLLAQSLNISRVEATRLLSRGGITINGQRASDKHKGAILSPGDTVSVSDFTPPLERAVIPRPDLPLDILTQGDGWAIVNKPAGAPVHPLEPDEDDTVLNAFVARFPQTQGVGEAGLRSGVVHRLDVETTGTLLFATNQSAWDRFRAAFQEHATRKTYLAIVEGTLVGSGRENLNLTVAQHRPARVAVVTDTREHHDDPSPGGRGAVRLCTLTWRVIEALKNATLIEVELGTGFLHQIRATFAYKHHPVLGDKLYGANISTPFATRPMLHALRLSVLEAAAEAPLPDDMKRCLENMR